MMRISLRNNSAVSAIVAARKSGEQLEGLPLHLEMMSTTLAEETTATQANKATAICADNRVVHTKITKICNRTLTHSYSQMIALTTKYCKTIKIGPNQQSRNNNEGQAA